MPGPASYPATGNLINSFYALVPINTGALTAGPTTTTRTFSVPGLRIGDVLTLNPPASVGPTTGVVIGSVRVSATDTMEVVFGNLLAGTPVPPVGDYLLQVDRAGYDNPLTQAPRGALY